jgi:hypothetical protein
MTSTSAKSFVRPAYNVKNKGGKIMSIMKEILWTNNLNLVDDIPMMNLKVHCKCNYSSCRVGRWHYFDTDLHT